MEKFIVEKKRCRFCNKRHYTPPSLDQCEAKCSEIKKKKDLQLTCKHKFNYSSDYDYFTNRMDIEAICKDCGFYKKEQFNIDYINEEIIRLMFEIEEDLK